MDFSFAVFGKKLHVLHILARWYSGDCKRLVIQEVVGLNPWVLVYYEVLTVYTFHAMVFWLRQKTQNHLAVGSNPMYLSYAVYLVYWTALSVTVNT